MFEHIENLKVLNILQACSVRHGVFLNRPSHAFILKRSGQSRYRFHDSSILLCAGEVLFIPKGETYTVDKVNSGESRYVLINFQADLDTLRPEKFGLSGQADTEYFATRLCGCMTTDSTADRYRATALLYGLLAQVCDGSRTPYNHSDALRKLEPAVQHLRQHLFDPDLLIGQLHTLCGLSDPWFRRLFQARFGTSPKQYVLTRRLEHAKAVLEHGEYNTVAEVAALAGFSDPLYFTKAFHRRYGFPPSACRDGNIHNAL